MQIHHKSVLLDDCVLVFTVYIYTIYIYVYNRLLFVRDLRMTACASLQSKCNEPQ